MVEWCHFGVAARVRLGVNPRGYGLTPRIGGVNPASWGLTPPILGSGRIIWYRNPGDEGITHDLRAGNPSRRAGGGFVSPADVFLGPKIVQFGGEAAPAGPRVASPGHLADRQTQTRPDFTRPPDSCRLWVGSGRVKGALASAVADEALDAARTGLTIRKTSGGRVHYQYRPGRRLDRAGL